MKITKLDYIWACHLAVGTIVAVHWDNRIGTFVVVGVATFLRLGGAWLPASAPMG